ncbi:MAG TPA: type I 3-dehydroquinate dehydratase [Vicinamibacterales bacterium]|nr:type I 3-dehydroquinate dehydratase [Vicinamibacterales bacterium]
MANPLLCVSVAAGTVEELRRRRDEASALADLVELRLDRLERPDVRGALSGRTGPVLVTCRPAWEGGGFEGAEEDRIALLEEARRAGADYVDVEWRSDPRDRSRILRDGCGKGVVLSLHEFEGAGAGLEEQCRAMLAAGAEVAKVAVTARCLADNLPLLRLGRRYGSAARLALVAMGTPGIPSRVLAAHFGSCWTYAGEGIAPGQLPPARLLDEYRFRAITPATAIYGIAGRPIGHSVSPAMHNAAFAALGVDAVYVPFEAEGIEDFRLLALELGLRGASITAPFKVDIVPYLSRADRRVHQAEAANTVKVRGDHWDGRNTDADACLAPLEGRVRLGGLRVALVGAGGAARAVAAALAGSGAVTTVFGRRAEAAARVAAIAGGEVGRGRPEAGSWDLLINATPAGTWPETDRLPVPLDCLGGGLVYDLVYNPPRTALMAAAEAAGCRALGGLDMLVAQAALQIEWWTGARAPRRLMHERALARLAQEGGA